MNQHQLVTVFYFTGGTENRTKRQLVYQYSVEAAKVEVASLQRMGYYAWYE